MGVDFTRGESYQRGRNIINSVKWGECTVCRQRVRIWNSCILPTLLEHKDDELPMRKHLQQPHDAYVWRPRYHASKLARLGWVELLRLAISSCRHPRQVNVRTEMWSTRLPYLFGDRSAGNVKHAFPSFTWSSRRRSYHRSSRRSILKNWFTHAVLWAIFDIVWVWNGELVILFWKLVTMSSNDVITKYQLFHQSLRMRCA